MELIENIEPQQLKSGSGGYGDGDGGYGYGYGDGYGYGYGSGGYGSGGYGDGGYGDGGYGDGYGDGGYGYGYGDGYGYGSGYGSGYSYGYGYGYCQQSIKVSKPGLAYHYIKKQGGKYITRSGQKVKVCEVLYEPKIKLCSKGFHSSLSKEDAKFYAPEGSVLTLVEYWGEVIYSEDKFVSTHRRIVKEVLPCPKLY